MGSMFKNAFLFLFLLFMTPVAFADGGDIAPRFKDVRVGETEGQTRVVIICADWCEAKMEADGSFFLTGVAGVLNTDMRKNGGFVSGLVMKPVAGGAILTIATAKKPGRVVLGTCGEEAICVDYTHEVKTAKLRTETLPTTVVSKKVIPKKESIAKEAVPKPLLVSKKTLRGAETVKSQKPPQNTVLTEITRDLLAISPAPLSPATCSAAQATLQKDAWSLDAYRLVALCKATQGKYAEADRLLVRLQQFAPDDKIAAQARPMIAAAQKATPALSRVRQAFKKLR